MIKENRNRIVFIILVLFFIFLTFVFVERKVVNANNEESYKIDGAYSGTITDSGFYVRFLTDTDSVSGNVNSIDVNDQRTLGYFLVNDKPITEESDIFYHGSYYNNNPEVVFFDGDNTHYPQGNYYISRFISWAAVDTVKNADNSASFTLALKKGNHLGNAVLEETYKVRVLIDDVTKKSGASIKVYEVVSPNIKEYNFTENGNEIRLYFYFNTNIKTNLSNIVPPFRNNILVNGIKLGEERSGSCYFCADANNKFQIYLKNEWLKDVGEENIISIPKGSVLSESEMLPPNGNYNIKKMGRILDEDITLFVTRSGDSVPIVRFGTSMGKPYQRFGYNFAFPINIDERFGDQSLNGYVENWRADYFLFNGENVTSSSTEKYYQGYFTYAENLAGYDKSNSFAHYYTTINQNYLKSLDTDGNGEVSITLTYKKGARFSYYYVLDRDYTYRFDFKNVNNDSPSSSDVLITELFEITSLEVVKGKESDTLLLKTIDLNNKETIRICKAGETYSIKSCNKVGYNFASWQVVDINKNAYSLSIIDNKDGTCSFSIPNDSISITPVYEEEEEPVKYTITFNNYDNSLLKQEFVISGAIPNYLGETPIKEYDGDDGFYEFVGWTPTLVVASGDTTYTAVFEFVNLYNISFLDFDEKVLLNLKVRSGDYPVYSLPIPTREEDACGTYIFVGWTPSIEAALSDTVYEAQYRTIYKKYTINFDLNGGIGEDSKLILKAGMKVVFPNKPYRLGYYFAGWYLNEELYDVEDEVYSNLILKAKWVEYTLNIKCVNLSLSDNIVLNLYVDAKNVENIVLNVNYDGFDFELKDYSMYEGYYKFEFDKINPQHLGDVIKIFASGDNGEKEIFFSETKEYSIVKYCETLLDKTKDDFGFTLEKFNAMRQVVIDLLYYGDACQNYTNYNIDSLVTSILSDQDVPSSFVSPSLSDKRFEGDKNKDFYIESVGLRYSSKVGFVFNVKATTDITLKIEKDNGQEYLISPNSCKGDIYTFYFDNISICEVNKIIKVSIISCDMVKGQVLYYSIKSNVYSLNKEDEYSLLIQRAYVYGLSALKYEEIE